MSTDSSDTSQAAGFHHVAYACRDIHENHRFYEDLIGLELVKTEVTPYGAGFFRHTFYDTGDGSCMAFFDLHGVGEEDKDRTDISTGLGMPLWVNHIALKRNANQTAAIVESLHEAGHGTYTLEHGWCRSTYVTDPNGISLEFCVDTPGFEPDRQRALELLDAIPESTVKIV
ncbi:MAG: VOC family protein [Acidimicrobiales bacterium]|nr:VOC family protein [Acidimicrobiales bacterium]MDP6697078.1 VOC family protein [Acidimicrobiales bacterium]